MSDQLLRLVAGLTSPRVIGQYSTADVRVRSVLFALALLADDEGRCSATQRKLHSLTLYSPDLIRLSIRELERRGQVHVTSGGGTTRTTYQLDKSALEEQQYQRRQHSNAIARLLDYGVDDLTLARVQRERPDLETMDDLGAEVRSFVALGEAGSQGRRGFHHQLGVRDVGRLTAARILNAYLEWANDRPASDASAGADPGE